jgi:hypothetical protein
MVFPPVSVCINVFPAGFIALSAKKFAGKRGILNFRQFAV